MTYFYCLIKISGNFPTLYESRIVMIKAVAAVIAKQVLTTKKTDLKFY